MGSAVRAGAMGWLYFAGATIGAVSLILPHPASSDDAALWSNVALAYAAAIGVLLLGRRAPVWFFHAALAAGALIVTRAVVLSGEPVSFYTVWYVWIGLYAFYFFGRRAAAAHVTVVAVLFGMTLAAEPASSPLARWLTTVSTLVVAGIFIDTLVRRAHQHAAAAARAAQDMASVAKLAHELASVTDGGEARELLRRSCASLTGAREVAIWEPSSAEEAPAPRPGWTWQPVLQRGMRVAALGFGWRDARRAPTTLLELLAAEAAATLQRLALMEQLARVARTDELTGMPNRRAWNEHLAREIAHARRSGAPLCVVVLDIDHFKRFNDAHGHQAGDLLLKQAAASWSAQLRTTDVLCRYGGEEFVLALPSTDHVEAARVVERLRLATPEGESCSAGVVWWDGAESGDDLVSRADEALYAAKGAGRDCAILA